MSDSNVNVAIVGDSSGVESAAEAAANAIKDATQQMRDALSGVKSATQDAFGGMGEAAKTGSAEFNAALEKANAATIALANAQAAAKEAMSGYNASLRLGAITESEFNQKRLESKQALSAVEAEYRNAIKALQAYHQAESQTTVSAGQARFAMRDLGYQISDISTQFAMGTSPMMIFAMQGSQVVQALSLMQTEAKGLIGFLGGIWGTVIMGAVAVLGPFISKLMESGDAAGDAADKYRSAADEARGLVGAMNALKLNQANIDLNKKVDERMELENIVAKQPMARDPKAGIFDRNYEIGGAQRRIDELKQEEMGLRSQISLAEGMNADADAKKNKTKGGKKDSGGGDKTTVAQSLDEELTMKKTAWALEQDAQGTFQQFSLQAEADFWAQSLERTDLTEKDRYAVQQKWLAARQALKREEIADTITGYKDSIAAAENNWTEKLQLLRRERDFVSQMYGAQSKEAAAVNREIAQAEREAARQREQIARDLAKAKAEYELAGVDEAEAAARFEVEMGRMTYTQLLAMERQFENQRHAIRVAELKQQLPTDPARDPVKFNQINKQIEALNTQHQSRMTQIDRQAALQRTQVQRQAIQSLSSSWGNALGQMMTGQMSFANGIKSMWQGLMGAISQALAQMIEQWLVKQLTALILGHTAQAVTGLAMVTSNAAVAGSAAFASTAAIPIIGPAMAPAAAAAAFAGAMAFAPLASAEGGDWQVREGLYNLHKDEMVLPAWAATPLRNMIQSGANSNTPTPANNNGGGGLGDLHLHVSALDARSFKRFAMDNKGPLADALRKYARDGGR